MKQKPIKLNKNKKQKNILLDSCNEEYFMQVEKEIDIYLESDKSTKIIKKYIVQTDVKPKNIYTEKTNFKQRYKRELGVLCKILSFIPFPHDITKQVVEIEDFFPFCIDKKLEKTSNIDDQILFIFSEVSKYFENINSREYGEYYSSECLINMLLENLTNDISINKKVIDPASGGGFFLFYYLKFLLKRTEPSNIDIIKIQSNIYGNDIFPFSIIISKLLLGKLLEKYTLNEGQLYRFNNIKIKNTLETLTCIKKDNEKYDLIIGNPPYFRIDPHENNNICNCVSYGHNYIHNLFIHWSIQHLKDGGEFGMILPQSILSGFYYQKMRKEIVNNLSINLIISDKEHEKAFSVQQDIMLFIATRETQNKNYHIGTFDSKGIEKYPIESGIIQNKYNVIPLFKNRSEYDKFKKLSTKPIVMKFKNFKIGTGNFVWNQNKELCMPLKSKGCLPLISGTSISREGIKLETNRKSAFPYCIPIKEKYIQKDKMILYRRMSPIGNKERMVATIIDPEKIEFLNGYVIENHVNYISSISKTSLIQLLKFITSKDFNYLLNSFCHTNQVSSNDLKTIFELLERVGNE